MRQHLIDGEPPPRHLNQKFLEIPYLGPPHITQRYILWVKRRLCPEAGGYFSEVFPWPSALSWYRHHPFWAPPLPNGSWFSEIPVCFFHIVGCSYRLAMHAPIVPQWIFPGRVLLSPPIQNWWYRLPVKQNNFGPKDPPATLCGYIYTLRTGNYPSWGWW